MSVEIWRLGPESARSFLCAVKGPGRQAAAAAAMDPGEAADPAEKRAKTLWRDTQARPCDQLDWRRWQPRGHGLVASRVPDSLEAPGLCEDQAGAPGCLLI